MEPSLGKGEQSREEAKQPDHTRWDELVEQENQRLDADYLLPKEEDQLQPNGDMGQIESDIYDLLGEADQPYYAGEESMPHLEPDGMTVTDSQTQLADEANVDQAAPDATQEQETPAPPSGEINPMQESAAEEASDNNQAQPTAETEPIPAAEEVPEITQAQPTAEAEPIPAAVETSDNNEAQPDAGAEPVPATQPGNPAEESQTQVPVDLQSFLDDQANLAAAQNQSQATNAPDELPVEQETEPSNEIVTPITTEFLPLPAFDEVPTAANPRKIALILSGGGARGAFHVGAEKYAREVKGYQWDIIAGVSVGAMNGAMLAMHRFGRLLELWDNISDSQVYTGGFNIVSLVKILLGAKSFYGNEPLKKMMQAEFEAGQVIDDLHVGAVSLISGEYVQFTRQSLELSKAILASASIPVVWPPVDVSADYPAMVDGGVRNLTPVGDVLDLEPDEIVIINCGNENPPSMPNAPSNVLSIGMRALDIMQNEIFVNDMNEFLRINALVHEAEQQGAVLHHLKSGRVLKYYPCQVIEPDSELGDVLDFSQKSVQAALKAGVRRAREVLGRP